MSFASDFLKKLSTLTGCLTLALFANAQDLHETFTVLGEYIPDVIRQDKIHTLPDKTFFTMPTAVIPYATAGLAGNFAPSVGVVDPPLWKARLQKPPKGYLDFGIGNYYNMVGSAGYQFLNTHSTQAGLWLQHNSWWGFHPNLSPQTADYEKKLLNDRLALYLTHSFAAGTLSANLQYHGAWFNYYGAPANVPSDNPPSQTIVNPSVSIAWKGTETTRWAYALALNYHYFSFRRYQNIDGQKENTVALDANAAYRLNESSTIALTLQSGAYLYTNPFQQQNNPSTNYGLISLVPHYKYDTNNLHITAGADLALAINAGHSLFNPQNRQSRVFHAAPHVNISYSAGVAAISLHANGGVSPNTLQAAADADIYTSPILAETTPQYTPINAGFALSLNPHRIFTASLHADYAITHGLYPGGDYMLHIADNTNTTTSSLYGFTFGADISLKPINWCSLSAELNYSPQSESHGYFNGYDRPRWLLNTTALFNPTDRITLAINYNYRGVRNHYRTLTDGTTIRTRLQDLTYLNAQASWRIIKPLTIWLQARNILGCSADILPGQPAPRATFTAGFALTF